MYEPLFLPSCDVFPSTASVDCLVLPAQSTPRCMDVAGDWSFSPFCSTSVSLASCHTSSQPSRKWWVDVTEPCFQLHRLPLITCRLKWWGLIFLNKCTLLSTTFRYVWSTPLSCHKVFVGYFPSVHLLWKVTWLYVLWGFICWQICNLSWEPCSQALPTRTVSDRKLGMACEWG